MRQAPPVRDWVRAGVPWRPGYHADPWHDPAAYRMPSTVRPNSVARTTPYPPRGRAFGGYDDPLYSPYSSRSRPWSDYNEDPLYDPYYHPTIPIATAPSGRASGAYDDPYSGYSASSRAWRRNAAAFRGGEERYYPTGTAPESWSHAERLAKERAETAKAAETAAKEEARRAQEVAEAAAAAARAEEAAAKLRADEVTKLEQAAIAARERAHNSARAAAADASKAFDAENTATVARHASTAPSNYFQYDYCPEPQWSRATGRAENYHTTLAAKDRAFMQQQTAFRGGTKPYKWSDAAR